MGWLYSHSPGLESRPYDEQMQARNESLFGVADFYSANLNKMGHEAFDVHVNNEFIQKAWANEHSVDCGPERIWNFQLRKRVVPWVSRIQNQPWRDKILAEQIRFHQPDVILNQAMDTVGSRFLKGIRQYCRLLVGQIASPLPKGDDWSAYDLVISSLPNFVDYFRNKGVSSELSKLAFEASVLGRLGDAPKEIPVSFVGNFSRVHKERAVLLEYLCKNTKIKVWGTNIKNLPLDSPVRHCYQGNAWGIEMYRIFQKSRITVNNHEKIVMGSYANNCRMYEATGCGTLLITDWKENLHEMFESGKEVVTYRTPEECAEKVRYYLNHEEERKKIAAAGQERTLRDHTYRHRAEELVDMVKRHRK